MEIFSDHLTTMTDKKKKLYPLSLEDSHSWIYFHIPS